MSLFLLRGEKFGCFSFGVVLPFGLLFSIGRLLGGLLLRSATLITLLLSERRNVLVVSELFEVIIFSSSCRIKSADIQRIYLEKGV